MCRHFTIDYAARIGVAGYERIAGGFPRTTSLLGEWIFSHALQPRSPAQQESYLAQTFGDAMDPMATSVERELRIRSIEQILGLAAGAGDFVDYAAREILAHEPQVVGLTSVFEQNLAALALAQRLRALAPGIRILLGGANCEGVMGQELALRYPFIDLVVSGEADLVIAPLVAGLLRGERWEDNAELQPLVDLDASTRGFLQAKMVHSLADQPRPGFDAYFEDLAAAAGRGGQREGRNSDGDFARLLVGREAPLHILRPQWGNHGVSQQAARYGRRGRARLCQPVPRPEDCLRRATSWTAATSRACIPSWRDFA